MLRYCLSSVPEEYFLCGDESSHHNRQYNPAEVHAGSGTVMLAHDTRPSAEELIKAAGSGVQALGGLPIVCGLLTTPQLHWMVHRDPLLGCMRNCPALCRNLQCKSLRKHVGCLRQRHSATGDAPFSSCGRHRLVSWMLRFLIGG